jgi:hypothetical protein
VLFEKKELIKKISAGCLSNRVAFHPTDSNRQGGFGLKLKVTLDLIILTNFFLQHNIGGKLYDCQRQPNFAMFWIYSQVIGPVML